MLRQCSVCSALIDAADYERHRQAHRNRAKPYRMSLARTKHGRRALERDGYRCRVCRRTKLELQRLGLQLEVHHINGNPNDNRPSNLMPLCSDHHPRGPRPAP